MWTMVRRQNQLANNVEFSREPSFPKTTWLVWCLALFEKKKRIGWCLSLIKISPETFTNRRPYPLAKSCQWETSLDSEYVVKGVGAYWNVLLYDNLYLIVRVSKLQKCDCEIRTCKLVPLDCDVQMMEYCLTRLGGVQSHMLQGPCTKRPAVECLHWSFSWSWKLFRGIFYSHIWFP